MFGKSALLVVGSLTAVVASAFEVSEKDGEFVIADGEQVVVSRLAFDRGQSNLASRVKSSYMQLADGTKVWNQWDETRDGRFRMEVARHVDGTVEISTDGQVEPFDEVRARMVKMEIPDSVLLNQRYEALIGDGRAWKQTNGVFTARFGKTRRERNYYRWIACDGIVFDFGVLGGAAYDMAYTENAIRGVWSVTENQGRFTMHGGSLIKRSWGGFIGTKVVLRKGNFGDYDRYHFIRKYHYGDHLKRSRLVAFASPKRGAAYEEGDFEYDGGRGFGWATAGSRRAVVGHKEGALYSAVAGKGKASYRFSGLYDGFYIFTVKSGNHTGEPNGFSIRVNGETLADRLTVAKGTARVLSKAIRVIGGTADVELEGEWLVSAIGVQPVLGDGEDFSMRRGFWVTDGYEPCVLYRNRDTAAKPVLPVADETYALPKPGSETAAKPRNPPTPVEQPDPELPSLAWMKNGKVGRVVGNNVTMAEFEDADKRRRYFDQETNGRGYSALMFSGMHSRHTYLGSIERGIEATRLQAAETHRRGMKYIDHHDATLLWNIGNGLRVLMERVPELIRAVDDGLPSFQLCPCNRTFCERYYAYLRQLVEAGVDGFQIDEMEFWRHGCVCQACRERFLAETGWMIPANECDRAWNDPNSPLRKRWFDWRVKTITNWFVELRRRLKDIKPDLVLNMYTTHWGFASSMPSRGGSNDLIDLGRAINYFGTEVMSRNVMKSARSLMPLRKAKNILNIAYGTPIWGWYYGTSATIDYFSWAVANMHGQVALLGDNPPGPEIPDYHSFGASSANMHREGASMIAKVGILYSGYSRDWNRGCSSISELLGTAQELERLHIPYEMIGDMSVDSAHLDKYRVFFVGTSNCLSDDEIAELLDYANRGGIVLLSAMAATCNELGIARDQWPFADILGMRPKKGEPAVTVERQFGQGKIVYTSLLRGSEFCARELTPPNVCKFNPDLEREREFAEYLKQAMAPGEYWQIKAPPKVYTTLWREKNGDIVVHLLNATATDIPYGVASDWEPPAPEPFPAIDEDIVMVMALPAGVKAIAASPDYRGQTHELVTEPLDGGKVKITLPKTLLKAYTLIRITACCFR